MKLLLLALLLCGCAERVTVCETRHDYDMNGRPYDRTICHQESR